MLLKKYALPCLIAASLVTAGCESRYMAPLLVGSAAVIGTAALVGYAASQEKKKKDPAHQASATLYDQAPVLEGYDGPYRAFFSESRERSGDYVVSLSDASSSSFDKIANQRGVSEFLLSDMRQEDNTLEDRWNNSEYNHEKHGVFCYFRKNAADDVRFLIARRGR